MDPDLAARGGFDRRDFDRLLDKRPQLRAEIEAVAARRVEVPAGQ